MRLATPLLLLALLPLGGCLVPGQDSSQRPETDPPPPQVRACAPGPVYRWALWEVELEELPKGTPPEHVFLRLDGVWQDALGQGQSWAEYLPVDRLAGDGHTLLIPAEPEFFPGGGAPGTFEGEASALLLWEDQILAGPKAACHLATAGAFQVVQLNPVQDFSVALARFGLEAAEDQLLDLLAPLAQAYYAGFAVEFRTQPPEDFLAFLRLDLLGRDPSGLGLLGLDATPGKDQGNRVLDEILGGYSRPARRAGQVPWGGIFLDSFLAFSPSHSSANALADPAFDELFAPFSPELGGQPLQAAELRPGAPRAKAAGLALQTLAQLLASTAAHEVGHCLGLAQVPGQPDALHQPGDNPRYLMDEGRYRPFGERAALDSKIEVLSRPERLYLGTILPLSEEASAP